MASELVKKIEQARRDHDEARRHLEAAEMALLRAIEEANRAEAIADNPPEIVKSINAMTPKS